jgi:acetoin utilization protein AcuB
MLMPTVSRYMTMQPHAVASTEPMAAAHRLMREYGFRHLPVIDDDNLVGIVSDRDLHLLETLRDVDPEQVSVREAMTTPAVVVPPQAPLDQVVELMSERRLGSVVIVDRHRVAGIFTATDALWALLDLLRRVAAG